MPTLIHAASCILRPLAFVARDACASRAYEDGGVKEVRSESREMPARTDFVEARRRAQHVCCPPPSSYAAPEDAPRRAHVSGVKDACSSHRQRMSTRCWQKDRRVKTTPTPVVVACHAAIIIRRQAFTFATAQALIRARSQIPPFAPTRRIAAKRAVLFMPAISSLPLWGLSSSHLRHATPGKQTPSAHRLLDILRSLPTLLYAMIFYAMLPSPARRRYK